MRDLQEGKLQTLCSPFWWPLLTKTIYANAKGWRWKALPDKIRCFQTGCRAELADVLSLQRGTLLNKSRRWLSASSASRAKSCISLEPSGRWLRVCLAGAGLASHRSTGEVRALIEMNTDDPITTTELPC